MLGAGAYGTVLAAVHRSTGRQVAIKTMLKKYLLSDAEKASVEREIEIQKVLRYLNTVSMFYVTISPHKLRKFKCKYVNAHVRSVLFGEKRVVVLKCGACLARPMWLVLREPGRRFTVPRVLLFYRDVLY